MSAPRTWRENPQRYRREANRCRGCGRVHYPPRLVCAGCGGRDFESVVLPAEVKLVTYTIIRVPPSEFQGQAPYPVGIVEFENGCRTTVQIADCPLERLAIGMPLRLEFRRIQEEGDAGVLCYGHKAVPA